MTKPSLREQVKEILHKLQDDAREVDSVKDPHWDITLWNDLDYAVDQILSAVEKHYGKEGKDKKNAIR